MQTSCTELTLLTFFKKGELFQGDSIQRGILIQEIRYWQFLKELFKLRQIGYHFKKWNSNVGVSFFVLLHSCKAIRKNIFAMLARSQKSLMRLYAFFNYLFNQKHSTNSVTFSVKPYLIHMYYVVISFESPLNCNDDHHFSKQH